MAHKNRQITIDNTRKYKKTDRHIVDKWKRTDRDNMTYVAKNALAWAYTELQCRIKVGASDAAALGKKSGWHFWMRHMEKFL